MAELKEKHVSLGIATPPPQASVPWCGLGEALFSAVLLPAPHLFPSPLCAQEADPHGLVTQTPGPLAWANAEGPDERLGGLLPASLLAELESEPSQMNAGFCQIIRELLPLLWSASTWPPGAFWLPRSVPGPSQLTSTCVCSLDKGVTPLRRILLLFSH